MLVPMDPVAPKTLSRIGCDALALARSGSWFGTLVVTAIPYDPYKSARAGANASIEKPMSAAAMLAVTSPSMRSMTPP